ncbi:MAG: XdhC family protein [Streptosporangiales bacterium]|nr:XdhC family protein [Streptosporangiales bacterium]MBO0890965.1 XdhC family protein [Acidothermales bacterium]
MDENGVVREVGRAIQRWASDGVGVVRVLERHGFGTVEPGQLLAGAANGSTAGRLLRGAVDDVAVPMVAAAVAAPKTVETHVDEGPAVAAGLACAGGCRLLGHPLPAGAATALGEALEAGHPTALASTADGGRQLVVTWTPEEDRHGTLGTEDADGEAAAAARQLLRNGATATRRVTAGELDVLVDLWVPVPTLLVIGSGAIGDALLAQAQLLGWTGRQVTELDEARTAVAGFSSADVLVLLDHGGAFDAVLIDGVRQGRGFLGALGSRHTQQGRMERLRAAGLSDEHLARLHAPVGLDLGARTPAESAVSICAEVIAVRSGRTPQPLGSAEGSIGA